MDETKKINNQNCNLAIYTQMVKFTINEIKISICLEFHLVRRGDVLCLASTDLDLVYIFDDDSLA